MPAPKLTAFSVTVELIVFRKHNALVSDNPESVASATRHCLQQNLPTNLRNGIVFNRERIEIIQAKPC